MKQFIKGIFIFLIIPLIPIISALLVIQHVSKTIDYKINSDITEVYVGDSHLQLAVMDSLFYKTKNISTAGESFYFSYYKLKKLLENNHGIQKVYLGFSYHSLSNYYDDFINGKNSCFLAPHYFYSVPIEEQLLLVHWNLKNFPTFSKDVLKTGYGYLYKDPAYSFGGYTNPFNNTIASKKSMDKRLKSQFYKYEKLNDFSDINLLYLTEIINLCKAKKINLVLLSTPLHPYYRSKIPDEYINKYNEIVHSSKLEVLDFRDLSFSDSSFIPDGDHLSVEGARQFSKELIKMEHPHAVNVTP